MKTAALDQLASLSSHAREILTSSAGNPEPLIRAELFGTQRFEEHGRSLAQAQAVRSSKSWGESLSFFPRVDDNIAALRKAYDYIATLSQSGQYVTPAAEWLLDNFHLVEAQLQQIHEGVPRRYYADLPKLADKPLLLACLSRGRTAEFGRVVGTAHHAASGVARKPAARG